MALITLSAYTGAATINPYLSAFGPDQSGVYDAITIKTVTSPVTAFITAYNFTNAQPYENESAIWTLSAGAFSTLPLNVTSTGFTLGLSGFTATVGEGALGVQTALLNFTLSAFALSSYTGSLSAQLVSSVSVDTVSQTLTFPLTAVNLPYNNRLCQDRFRRQWLAGI